MTEIAIRPARDADALDLCALISAIFAEYPGVLFLLDEMPELRRIASTFDEAGGQFWCAERDGRVVGCVGYTPSKGDAAARDGDCIELKKLYVADTERGQGLGGRLCVLVEEAAAERDAAVELWSDTKFLTAHRFYERRGYQRGEQTRKLHDASDTEEFYFRRPRD